MLNTSSINNSCARIYQTTSYLFKNILCKTYVFTCIASQMFSIFHCVVDNNNVILYNAWPLWAISCTDANAYWINVVLISTNTQDTNTHNISQDGPEEGTNYPNSHKKAIGMTQTRALTIPMYRMTQKRALTILTLIKNNRMTQKRVPTILLLSGWPRRGYRLSWCL